MDISYLLALQNFREMTGGILNPVMIAFSSVSMGAITLLIPALFIWCINKKQGYFMMFSFGIAVFINQTMKLIACVYRPWIRDPRVEPMEQVKPGATGYSFPSGHTTNATSVYGAMVVCLKKTWVRILLAAVVLGVAFSRNYAGVHTPQDVVVGLLCGVCGIVLAGFVLKWTDKGVNHDLIVCIAGLILVTFAIIFIETKAYPMDYVGGVLLVNPENMKPDFYAACGCTAGMLISWIIERRWVKFEIEGTAFRRILRFLIGVTAILLMQLLLFPFIYSVVGICAGYFIRGLILYLFILVIYPWLFQKAGRKKCQ